MNQCNCQTAASDAVRNSVVGVEGRDGVTGHRSDLVVAQPRIASHSTEAALLSTGTRVNFARGAQDGRTCGVVGEGVGVDHIAARSGQWSPISGKDHPYSTVTIRSVPNSGGFANSKLGTIGRGGSISDRPRDSVRASLVPCCCAGRLLLWPFATWARP